MWEAKTPPTLTHCKLCHCFQDIQLLTVFFCWNGFILHVLLPGSGGAVAAPRRLRVLLLQGRKWRTGTGTAFALCYFFYLCTGVGTLMEWGIKPRSSGTGQGEGRSCDGMLSSRVVWSGVVIGPYDPSTAGMCQRLPSIPQECLHFTRLIQGDACHPLPQPGPIQPSGPAWFLLQAGERHGNAGAGMLTRRHAPALAHTHASSLLLPALPCMLFLLSVLLSSLRSTKDLVKASGSSVL